MAAQVKKKHRSPTRAERARQNRKNMTAAAYRLFVQRGYADTTMADIADAAGVAVQTLYFTFGTKAELLQRAYEHAVLGEDTGTPPERQPWYAQFTQAPDLTAALEILVANVAAIFARTAPLDEFVRAASANAEAARTREYNEQLRRRAWTDMLQHLSRFQHAPGHPAKRAVDIMMVIMSPATYQAFVNDYRWTPDQWQRWCRQTLQQQLFG
jgi:AcrR family transcriptional regulator